jgi:hypothetical protein
MNEPPVRQRSINEVALSRYFYRHVVPALLMLTAFNAASQLADPRRGTAVSAAMWGLQVVPALWLAGALVRGLDRADEWQRVAVLESLVCGFVVVMLALFAGGQLEAAGIGADHAPIRVAHSFALTAGVVVPLLVLLVKSRRAG